MIYFSKPDGDYGFLCNDYSSEFRIVGNVYSSVTEYLNIVKEKIRSSGAPDWEEIWNYSQESTLRTVLFEKFRQNPKLAQALLNTGSSLLCYCSSNEYWGIGLRSNNPDIHNMSKWTGKNRLGHCLMSVRDVLRYTF